MAAEKEQEIVHRNWISLGKSNGDFFCGGSENQSPGVRIGCRAQLVLARFCWQLISVTGVINWIIRGPNREQSRWQSSLSTECCWAGTAVNPAPARQQSRGRVGDGDHAGTSRPRAGVLREQGERTGQLLLRLLRTVQ